MKVCGDFGGVTREGDPCGRAAGWGTDRDTGTCKAHDVEKLESDKERFLTLLKNAGPMATMESTCAEAGTSVTTAWRWRQADPGFDAACERVVKSSLAAKLSVVEDSVMAQIVRGEAAATLVIFWMTNVARRIGRGDDWLHISKMEVTGKDGGPLETRELSDDDREDAVLKVLAARSMN